MIDSSAFASGVHAPSTKHPVGTKELAEWNSSFHIKTRGRQGIGSTFALQCATDSVP